MTHLFLSKQTSTLIAFDGARPFAESMTRVARTRSAGEEAFARAPSGAKLGVVARLREDVRSAPSNSALAKFVEEFATVTNKCVGRSITKVRV